MVFENLYADLTIIRLKFGITEPFQIPHITPGHQNKTNDNYFILDLTNPRHQKLFEYLKRRLKPDIEIYNQVCRQRHLEHLIIS